MTNHSENGVNERSITVFANWGATAAILALLSVAIGAFAAHGLKATLSAYQLSIVETGAKYQMYHAISILVVSAFACFTQTHVGLVRWIRVNLLFLLGTVLFSGSLYIFALTQIKWFVFVTPIGGMTLIIAWAYLAFSCYKFKER